MALLVRSCKLCNPVRGELVRAVLTTLAARQGVIPARHDGPRPCPACRGLRVVYIVTTVQ